MHPTLVTVCVAAAAGALSAAIVANLTPAPKPRTVTVVAAAPPSNKAASRIAAEQWPEMAQAEIDRLSAALGKVPAERRRPVVIFCHDDLKCGDLALNMENAFETAHWNVQSKPGPRDGMRGLRVNDAVLISAIAEATSLEPQKIDEAGPLGASIVVIGVHPKQDR